MPKQLRYFFHAQRRDNFGGYDLLSGLYEPDGELDFLAALDSIGARFEPPATRNEYSLMALNRL